MSAARFVTTPADPHPDPRSKGALMETFATIVAATESDLRRRLLAHPLIEALRENAVSLGHYVAYLRETYHLVRYTPKIYARAASRTADDRPELRNWFLTQACEESGH